MPIKTQGIIVYGPDFTCAALFAFNPKICIKAAPKLKNAFLGRGLEKCVRIAKSQGWEIRELPEIEDPPGWKAKRAKMGLP